MTTSYGCANFYDWIYQSMEHQHHANIHYPELALTASGSSSLADFEAQIRDLDPMTRSVADQEEQQWYRDYGSEWKSNNCSLESYVGESGEKGHSGHTPGVDPKKETPKARIKKIQQALKDRNYDPGKVDGVWGPKTCEAAYRVKIERLKNYSRPLDYEFFDYLGITGQTGQDYAAEFGEACAPWYTQFVKPTDSDLEAIQQALVRRGYLSSVSGKWDKTTCLALFKFQQDTYGASKGGVLDRETFVALGFQGAVAATYESLYATKCQSYWGGEPPEPGPPRPGPSPEPAPEDEDTAPQFQKAGIPMWLGVLLGAGAIGGAIYAAKKAKR